MKRCARCQATIISSELVMRARDLVFHVHCFSCAVCNSPLTKGDHFGMRDGAVLCRLHFEMPMTEPMPPGMFPPGMHHYPPPFPSPEFHHQIPPATPVESVGKVPFFNGAPTTPRQKGRPRKRKPKDLEGMTASLGEEKVSHFTGVKSVNKNANGAVELRLVGTFWIIVYSY
jgi:LIM homeobox protein 2/9